MGMLLHRTLMEQEDKGKAKVTKLADLSNKGENMQTKATPAEPVKETKSKSKKK